MSKEFDVFREKYWEEWPDAENDRELKSVLSDFFTAGRALGRREMKGECEAAVQESTVCSLPKGPIGEMYTRYALKAIEAIPEEV